MRRWFIVGLSLALLLAGAVRSQAASDRPKPGGTLTMGIRSDLLLTNPFVNVRSTQGRVLDLLFDPLLGLDAKGKIQPHLAESWEVSNDGKAYTFRLRRGIKFHNDQEMTAEDIKFSISYSINPKNGAQGFAELATAERAEVVDRYTVRIFLKKPNPAFLASLTAIRAFPVVPKDSVPEGVDKVSAFPPGTGPYKFAEWKPQQRIVLERFDQHWGHKSYIDRLVMKPIRDDTIRFTALRTGDVDLIERAPLEWVKQIAEGKVKGTSYAAAQHAELRGIEFNVAAPPFNNKKLRHAVAYAVNKQELFNAAFMAFGELTEQKYPKGHEWYFEGVPVPSYNPEKARALLKEAGYQGETIEFLVHSSLTDQAKATALQAQLKKVGMSMRIKLVDTGQYRSLPRKGEYSFRFDGGTLYPDPIMAYGELRCEPDLTKRANNTAGYCDKEMDALIDKGEKEANPERRHALFRQIVAKALDDLPEIYLGFVPQFFGVRDHVKNFATDSDANFRWWGGGLNHAWLDK